MSTSVKLSSDLSNRRKISGGDVALSYLFVLLFSVYVMSRLKLNQLRKGSQECEEYFMYCVNVWLQHTITNSHTYFKHTQIHTIINPVLIIMAHNVYLEDFRIL